MKNITGGELVASALSEQGLSTIFTLVGNQISPILVHMKEDDFNVIGVRHEQAAIHMADGWSQTKRDLGVAIISGGPGLANAVNGIVKAYMAKTPLLIIVGASVLKQKDMGGLQDIDQISIVKPFAKWSAVVYETERIPEYIAKATSLAMTGQKGPVVLEMPIDILKNSIDSERANTFPLSYREYMCVENSLCANQHVLNAIELIKTSTKPLVILGDEAYYADVDDVFIDFIDRLNIPVVTINKARGLVPDRHDLCFGNGRILEAGPALYALKNADLVITIGVEINYQMSFFKPPFFNESYKHIHITDNSTETAKNYKLFDALLIGSIGNTLSQIIQQCDFQYECYEWINCITEHEKKFFEDICSGVKEDSKEVHPYTLINELKKYLTDDTIFVFDGSNAMFWAALLFEAQFPGQVIIAPDGTHGTMGAGIPLAIGAKLARPEKKVLLYTGDGSFGFNCIELDTANNYNVPINIVVHNDEAWGFCESTQLALYNDTSATKIGATRYDKIAEAFGGVGKNVANMDDLTDSVKSVLQSEVFSCLNVAVNSDILAPGATMFNESLKRMR